MQGPNGLEKKERLFLLTASFVMLVIAFFQCFRTVHDLTWPFDTDFDRDMAFIRNTLDGHFGQDPTYSGQYLWYNPLVFSIEAMLVKITGLPINIIVTRAGLYLNLLGPLAFFFMSWGLFNLRVAATALLSYLFFAAGNIEGSGAATYSPWLYPVTFVQFFFYVNILLCYKAFNTGKYRWFLLLGFSIGLSFLGHAAPALIIVLILLSIQAGNCWRAWRDKNYPALRRYFLQGFVAFVPFIIVAFPVLYYIVGKYHMHIINKYIVEWRPDSMYWNNWRLLLRENISVSLVIAVIGFIWFYRNFRQRLPRLIIFNWLIISIGMYLYTSCIYGIREKFHIQLPETVPSYHYFFYLKALQSVFFGFGLLALVDLVLGYIVKPASPLYTGLLALILLVCAIGYFPFYKDRIDFSMRRRLSIDKGQDKDRIDAYNFLVSKIPDDKVILCPEPHSTFPVMASGRKMVCVSVLFSNPYLSFEQRYLDDSAMLRFLRTGEPASARQLFDDYQVSYVFLPNNEAKQYSSPLLGPLVMKNDGYSLFSLRR